MENKIQDDRDILRITKVSEDLDSVVIEYDGINLNTNKLETGIISIESDALFKNLDDIIRCCINIRKGWDSHIYDDLKKIAAKL